jgi:methylmalonyl-CoA/ethylmalonyl-CoA epimerase
MSEKVADRETTPVHIDHIALAVPDLEAAIHLFEHVLGFSLRHRRRVQGTTTGMIAAEMRCNGMTFVLCQGTEPASQVSRLVSEHGPGVAHIALAVGDVAACIDDLSKKGMAFDTDVISGPGLQQAFSSRISSVGFSFEFISRSGEEGFLQQNVEQLFDKLERLQTESTDR